MKVKRKMQIASVSASFESQRFQFFAEAAYRKNGKKFTEENMPLRSEHDDRLNLDRLNLERGVLSYIQ